MRYCLYRRRIEKKIIIKQTLLFHGIACCVTHLYSSTCPGIAKNNLLILQQPYPYLIMHRHNACHMVLHSHILGCSIWYRDIRNKYPALFWKRIHILETIDQRRICMHGCKIIADLPLCVICIIIVQECIIAAVWRF